MIKVYTHLEQGQEWIRRYQGKLPIFACILGFTATGLREGISAAGATPEDRRYTAIADGEFLLDGIKSNPKYPLPPLNFGASPVLISRAVVEALQFPVYLFNAGLPTPPAVPAIDLQGLAAQCLTSGQALPLDMVKQLFRQGLHWGEKLAQEASSSYVMIGECVVGGTTTALAVLTALGIAATGMISGSHRQVNHAQKWELVQRGLINSGYLSAQIRSAKPTATSLTEFLHTKAVDPMQIIAAVGDPMQIVAAGMTLAASRNSGVLLAGGTQMLAVYALTKALAQYHNMVLPVEQVVVGTTRWVAEDPSADTVGLAQKVGSVPLLATRFSFALSRYPQLRIYEQGFVKEGVGAGGCAIATHLYQDWKNSQLLSVVEDIFERYRSQQD